MSIIFPGNYVAHLNAYRGQGNLALPGVEFYRYVGVYEVTGLTSAGDLDLVIPSPDLRQDDKPRLDKPFVIPEGATVYSTAVNVINCVPAGATDTVTVKGVTPAAEVAAVASVFPAEGDRTAFAFTTALTALGSDTAVQATLSGDLTPDNSGSAAIGTSQSAVIVEVDFFMDAPAPDGDDTHLPYKTVAGQGT